MPSGLPTSWSPGDDVPVQLAAFGKVRVLIGPRFDLRYLKSWPRDEAVEEARRIIRERLWVMMECKLPIAPPLPPASTPTPTEAAPA